MENRDLVKSEVRFSQENHKYTLGDKTLSGITSIINRQLFPNKFSNIPEYILEKAAERGHTIHGKIELAMTIGGFDDDEDVMNFRNLIEERKVIATEYLVSDNEYVASMIDGVFDDYSLYDIKTTSSLDLDYLSWQLSIYAYLFELQNGVQAGKLYAIWLPKEQYGNPKMVEVERIDKSEIERLIDCERNGEQFVPTENNIVKKDVSSDLLTYEEVDVLANLYAQKKALDDAMLELNKNIKERMKMASIKKFSCEKIDITYIDASVKETFDAKRFKEAYPSLYTEFLKVSNVQDSVRIKVKDSI